MQAMFVSSTFKDMQGERDALHRLVMPRLREKAAEFAQGIQFVDLRWGISTGDLDSDEGAGKILEVCLEEIRQCKPYMIVLLGQRYGWMPSPALLESTAVEKDFSLDSYEMSVTELEIRYGMFLASGRMERCIFCLREDIPEENLPENIRDTYLAASQEDRQRMAALRRRICDTPGAHVLRYGLDWDGEAGDFTGYDRFADALEAKLEEVLLPTWQQYQSLPWQERQREEDRLLTQMHQDSFVGREREIRELMDHIDTHRVVILEGEGGCGKSAMMAQLQKQYRQKGVLAELFCCGNSSHCMSADQLTALLYWQTCLFSGREPLEFDDIHAQKVAYDKLMETYDGPRAVLFVDAIDQLSPDDRLYRSKFMPPKMSDRITLVISTTGAVRVDPAALPLGKRGGVTKLCKLTPPDKEELRQILHARFRAEHKQISRELADKLLENPTTGNMLGMELMVRQLVMLDKEDFEKIAALEQTMDSDRAINTYLLEMADGFSTDLERRINDYIDAVCRFVDKDEEYVIKTYLYIVALMQHGITEGEMEEFSAYIRKDYQSQKDNLTIQWLSSWSGMRFARLRRYMGNLLIRRNDGRIDFSHRLLREAMTNRGSINNLAPLIAYWWDEKPTADETVLENVLPILRRYYNTLDHEGKSDSFDHLIAYMMKKYIKAADDLATSEDLLEKAKGKRQMEILQRSVLSDLSGSRQQDHLNDYCGVLASAISDGAGPGHFTVWFFAVKIVNTLAEQSEREKAMALQLLCRVVRSLYIRREEDAAAGEPWQNKHDLWLLRYHMAAMRHLSQLRFSRSLGLVQLGSFYGLSKDLDFEKGVALAEHCIRQAPDSYIAQSRRALLYIYGVNVKFAAELRVAKLVPYLDMAVESAQRMLELTRQKEGIDRLDWVGNFVHIMAQCLEAMHNLKRSALFPGKKLTRWMEEKFRLVWDVASLPENEDRVPIADMAEFLLIWSRYKQNYNNRNREKHFREAIDQVGRLYYIVRKNDAWPLDARERWLMARLGAEAGFYMLHGNVPQRMEADGYTCYTARRFLVEKESGYLQAQAEKGFEYHYAWTLMLSVEASIYDMRDYAKAVELARRGEQEIIRLRQEWKKGSYATYDYVDLEKIQEYLQRVIKSNLEKLEQQ